MMSRADSTWSLNSTWDHADGSKNAAAHKDRVRFSWEDLDWNPHLGGLPGLQEHGGKPGGIPVTG